VERGFLDLTLLRDKLFNPAFIFSFRAFSGVVFKLQTSGHVLFFILAMVIDFTFGNKV